MMTREQQDELRHVLSHQGVVMTHAQGLSEKVEAHIVIVRSIIKFCNNHPDVTLDDVDEFMADELNCHEAHKRN